MKKVSILIWLMFLSITAAAKGGGVIGGGDATFRDLMTCQSRGIDPTHESSSFVKILQEIDFNGEPVEGSTLRMATFNAEMEVNNYYVTSSEQLFMNPKGKYVLSLWRFESGSPGNELIGEFVWNSISHKGKLKNRATEEGVEELELVDCQLDI